MTSLCQTAHVTYSCAFHTNKNTKNCACYNNW